ncbi:MAG: hypothetical protein ACEQSR_01445 [Candidatus Methylacidiphilales bacterium]
MNEPITPAQIKQLHVLLVETGQKAYKQDLMDMVCIDGRYPTSSKELFQSEATSLINWLKTTKEKQDNSLNTMRRKVISCLRECGFNKKGVADMPAIYKWVEKYSPFKKGLNDHNYNELVQLVTQAEIMKDKHLKGLGNG